MRAFKMEMYESRDSWKSNLFVLWKHIQTRNYRYLQMRAYSLTDVLISKQEAVPKAISPPPLIKKQKQMPHTGLTSAAINLLLNCLQV